MLNNNTWQTVQKITNGDHNKTISKQIMQPVKDFPQSIFTALVFHLILQARVCKKIFNNYIEIDSCVYF
jgi:hypothetical protein